MSEKLIVPFTNKDTIRQKPVSLHIDEKTGLNFRPSRVFGVYGSQIAMLSSDYDRNIHILTEQQDNQWAVSPPLFNLARERTDPLSLAVTSGKILVGTNILLEYKNESFDDSPSRWRLDHSYEFQCNPVTSIQIFDDGSFVCSDMGNDIILYNPNTRTDNKARYTPQQNYEKISDLAIIDSETVQGLLLEKSTVKGDNLAYYVFGGIPVSQGVRPTSGFLAGTLSGDISLYTVNSRRERILQELKLPKLDIGSERFMHSMTAIPGGLATLDYDQNGEDLYRLRIWGIKEGRFDNLANYTIDNKPSVIRSLPNGRLLLVGEDLLEIWTDTAASQKITPPLE